ncbi:DUF4134 family protein [Maribacter polysaccharolyticus]|uniref:DUF4134 family protein n=1 Tax=Maribacter polysaccharolyticus TaxID=3020831 RepID=UPI00237F73B9|nr:DUF4134 family protein [Maribacter polysaccharolyticus]MDE3744045.1 DUF4134 family protein [Maribacter polysaccharolyticus]
MQLKKAQRHLVRQGLFVYLALSLLTMTVRGQEDIKVNDEGEPTTVSHVKAWGIEGGAFYPYFSPMIDLTIAIGGFLALFGSIKVYNQWHLGVGHIERKITNLFGGGLFILVMGLVLKAIFT